VTTVHVEGVAYELRERIGGGPPGGVYRARPLGEGYRREVCIKRLGSAIDGERAAALLEEARLLATVRHANVVALLGFGVEPEGGPFLVLELVEGRDLRALCRALRATGSASLLPERVAVHVACALLRALGAVQRRLPGLVHRDVTPHNVLVSDEGEVKLADFGIALTRGAARSTGPRMVKGKPGYVAPEQIHGLAVDPRADLFAVGVVLYELLAGARPWAPACGLDELRAITQEPFVPLRERAPRVDRDLAAAVERLLARDPDDRFASAEDALRAVAPFGAGELGSLRLATFLRAAVAASKA
jgi:eukaryotic-like serine/threonine-protein kinase